MSTHPLGASARRFLGHITVGALVLGTVSMTLGAAPVAAATREGTADASFAGIGVRDTPYGGGSTSESVEDLVVLSDNSVVAVGSVSAPSGTGGLLRRYTPAGAVDLTFGTNGWVRLIPGFYTSASLGAGARSPGDRIVVAGRVASGVGTDAWVVARFLPSGGLDTSFTGDGYELVNEGVGEAVQDLVVTADGTVFVLGSALPIGGGPARTYVLKFAASGVPDSGFNSDGRAEVAGIARGLGIVVDTAGRPVIVGSTGEGPTEDARLARLTTTGAPDAAFFGSGAVTFPFSSAPDVLTDVALLPGGGILAVGAAFVLDAPVPRVPVTLRLTPAGAFDTSYGPSGNGGALINGYLGDALVTGLAIARDGKPLLALQTDSTLTVLRLRLSGAPARHVADTTFGSTAAGRVGSATLPLPKPGGSTHTVSTQAVAIDARGRILVAGDVFDPSASGDRIGIGRMLGDTTPPAAGVVAPLPAATVGTSLTVAWSASDVGSGAASFDVRSRFALPTAPTYSAYALVRTATAATSAVLPVAAGRTICFSVRARDRAGNVGPWGGDRCTATPLDDRNLARVGAWTQATGAPFFLGTATRSSSSGSQLLLFGADYRRLAVVVTTCPTCGVLEVVRGGVVRKRISLVTPTTVHRAVVAVEASATVLSGDVRLRQASAGKLVQVDGLVVSLAG